MSKDYEVGFIYFCPCLFQCVKSCLENAEIKKAHDVSFLVSHVMQNQFRLIFSRKRVYWFIFYWISDLYFCCETTVDCMHSKTFFEMRTKTDIEWDESSRYCYKCLGYHFINFWNIFLQFWNEKLRYLHLWKF